jgi:DNA-binding CsgD family transcriptional regulator/pimeloyl-ACP methyl ester carboxylesterase
MDVPALRYVTTPDGFSIAYTVCGEGPPLVYLPRPRSHTHLYWRTRNVSRLLYERLAANFTLICYDGRGMGSSQRGLPADFRIDDFATDLETVVDHLGLTHFSMLAQRHLGGLALQYAIAHPENVRGIVLWNPQTGDPAIDGWGTGDLVDLAAKNWDLSLSINARVGWAVQSRADPDLANTLVSDSVNQADTLIMLRAWQDYIITDILGLVTTPVLILGSAGGKNPLTSETGIKFIASRIKGSRLEIFDDHGAGLFNLEDEAPPGVRMMTDFLHNLPEARPVTSDNGSSVPQTRLSAREAEVLRLIARGLSNQQIADELVISVRTVERHINHIYGKLGVHNKAQATAYALSRSLIAR